MKSVVKDKRRKGLAKFLGCTIGADARKPAIKRQAPLKAVRVFGQKTRNRRFSHLCHKTPRVH